MVVDCKTWNGYVFYSIILHSLATFIMLFVTTSILEPHFRRSLMPTCKIAASNLDSGFYKEDLIEWIKSFDATLGKHLLIAFELIKLVFITILYLFLWACYHQKRLCFALLMLKILCKNPDQRLVSLREVGPLLSMLLQLWWFRIWSKLLLLLILMIQFLV